MSFPIPEDNSVVYSTFADHVHLKNGKCVQGGRCFLRTCVAQIGSLSSPLLLLGDVRVWQTAQFSPGSNGNFLVGMRSGRSMPITGM